MPDGLEPPPDDGPDAPAPPPPDDRLWRHPSEVGRAAATPPARSGAPIAPSGGGTATTHRMPLGAMLAAGVGVGLFVVGTFVVAGWLTTEREGDSSSSRTIHDVVYLSSSTTAATTASTVVESSRPGWLGISAVDVAGAGGVTVTGCDPGSPAERSLRPHDVIVSVDGTPTPTMAELIVVLAASRPGHRAAIRLVRDDATVSETVVLGRQP
jgi:hypothetical protein